MIGFQPRVSRAKAKKRIIDMALYGDHHVEPRPTTGQEVFSALVQRRIDPERLAEALRDHRRAVPFFENLVPPGSYQMTGGGTVQVVETATRKPLGPEVSGPATMVLSNAQALFYSATRGRDRAVAEGAYTELQTAIALGLASAEATVNEGVAKWNRAYPSKALREPEGRRLSLADKMREWVPVTSRGKLDLGSPIWGRVRELQKVRDEYTIHPQHASLVIPAAEFARHVNLFRDGIAALLFGLFWAYLEAMPSCLINARHMPDCRVSGG